MRRILLAILGILFLCSACNCGAAIHNKVDPFQPSHAKFADSLTEHKYNVTMRVLALCPDGMYVGSAVIVGPDLVYTAKHVAECDHGDALVMTGKRYDGSKVILEVAKKSRDYDIVVLRAVAWVNAPKPPSGNFTVAEQLIVNFKEYAQVRTDAPPIGEEVCFVGGGGDPDMFLEKCGKVFLNSRTGFGIGIIGVGGNSGGPIFDENGAVLGVVSLRDLTDTAAYAVSVRHAPAVPER